MPLPQTLQLHRKRRAQADRLHSRIAGALFLLVSAATLLAGAMAILKLA